MARQPSRQDEPAGFEHGRFKVCDLCGALNHAEWPECFICGWHGHFATDPESIYRAAREQREPRPAEAMLPTSSNAFVERTHSHPTLFDHLRLFFRHLLRRG